MADFDFVQSDLAETGGPGTTQDLAYPSNVTNGNLLIVAICRDGGANTATVAKQTGTATTTAFARAVDIDSSQHIEIWWAKVTATGSLTVRATYSASVGNHRIIVAEYVGPAGGIALDGIAALNNPNVTNVTSGNVSPEPTADALIVGAMTPTTGAVNPAAGGSFTIREEGALDGFCLEDFFQTPPAAIAATLTLDVADPANVVAAVFIDAGGAHAGASGIPVSDYRYRSVKPRIFGPGRAR